MGDYENETCEGCRFFDSNDMECDLTGIILDIDCYQERPCGEGSFIPSLQCRQVRALERIAMCVQIDPDGLAYFEVKPD